MRLAFEAAAGLVRVDDHVGVGQLRAGQVVVGHQHLQAQRVGRGHAFDAGDAVVHGDQQVGAARLHALARSAASGRSRRPRGRAPGSRRAARPAGAGRAGRPRRRWRRRSRSRRRCTACLPAAIASASSTAASRSALHAGGRQQARQAVVQFVLAQHAARRIQARQQRMDAGLLERPGGARRNVAGDDLHRASSTAAACRPAEQRCRCGAQARRRAAASRSARCARRTASACTALARVRAPEQAGAVAARRAAARRAAQAVPVVRAGPASRR